MAMVPGAHLWLVQRDAGGNDFAAEASESLRMTWPSHKPWAMRGWNQQRQRPLGAGPGSGSKDAIPPQRN